MHTEPDAAPSGSVPFDLSRDTFEPAAGRHAVRFRHAFGEDPRFALDALAPYAATLPPAWVRAHRAQYSPHEARGLEELPADELEGSVRELARSDASIRLYNLEHTAEFRDVAAAVDAPVRSLVGDIEGGVAAVNLGVFVASPGAVTPAHPDRHHNLLLSVDGTKEVWVEDDPDARARHLRVVDYIRRPEDGAPVLPPARSFVLGPGDGVYIPPYAFHWAMVLEGPAVGLSVGFSTPCTLRSGAVHDFDVRLRNTGMRPRPSRAGGTREKVKMQLAATVVRLARARDRVTRRGGRDTVRAGQEGADG